MATARRHRAERSHPPRVKPLSATAHSARRRTTGRGAPGTAGRSSDSQARTETVHLLAVASQPQIPAGQCIMTAVVPAYRCGTVPDSHRVPSHVASHSACDVRCRHRKRPGADRPAAWLRLLRGRQRSSRHRGLDLVHHIGGLGHRRSRRLARLDVHDQVGGRGERALAVAGLVTVDASERQGEFVVGL